MKTLFLIFAIVLISYQALPATHSIGRGIWKTLGDKSTVSPSTGDAQAATDTIACGRGGGGCQAGACRPGFQNVGTCRNGAMSCCRWPRPGE